MAETIISPGVFTRENDLSFVTPAPAEAGTAFIGPTVKGPVEIPTVVTSYGQYQRLFGSTFESGSTKQEFLTSISVRNFFNQGGSTALVTRVVNGSFTRGTSTHVSSSAKDSSQPFTIETLGEGILFNNSTGVNDAGALNSDGSLVSGSADNLRWEVSNINNSKGTFTLSVRRGDDSTKEKVVLETFTNLSLDPNSSNFISARIGDQVQTISGDSTYVQLTGSYANRSNYIRVASVGLQTLNYLGNDGTSVNADSAGVSYSGSLPIVGSGSFHGATGDIVAGGDVYYNGFSSAANIQGLANTDYDAALTLLSNKDDYQFNVIVVPGLHSNQHNQTVNTLVSLAESRGDCIAVIDTSDMGLNPSDVVGYANGVNSSYAATYYPNVQVTTETGRNQFVPPSVVIPGVYAANDNSSAPWFAPAGLVRGGIPGVIQAERKLTKTQRDTLYDANVNPIATFPGTGIAVFGQKTLQKKATALDRVNVRRLLIELKKFFGDQARNLVFEQNTIATRNRFLSAVNPYLESVVQRQGLYAFRVVMDDSNNTADVIDRNQLVGQVFIQPAKTAEFIVLDFTIEPTGASFAV
jgi:uncharacterized protein